MKKYFILYSLFLAICVYSLNATAAEILATGTCGTSAAACSYTIDSDGLLHISGNGKINDAAFAGWSAPIKEFGDTIRNVVIDKGITAIGGQAFQNSRMRNISIPNSVTTIESQAFYDTALTSVVIPKSVTRIDRSAFLYSGGLKDVTIEGSDVQIGEGAFAATGITHYIEEGKSKVTTKAGSLTEQRMKAIITSPRVAFGYIPDKPRWTIPEIEDAMGDSITGEMTFTFE